MELKRLHRRLGNTMIYVTHDQIEALTLLPGANWTTNPLPSGLTRIRGSTLINLFTSALTRLGLLCSISAVETVLMNLSFQLFSARNTPIDEALAIIRAAGYESVEAYGDNIVEGEAFSAALAHNKLIVSSLHINIGPLRDAADASVATAEALGISHVVCPYLEEHERPTSRDAWTALAKELSAIARFWNQQGFDFAWHNHDFEFQPLEDGSMPLTLLLEQAPELHWEIDVAWIVRAGASPVDWIEKYGDRISAIHIKDLAAPGECLDEDGWADVGYGVVDWKTLLPMLRKGPATIYAVEHDNPSDLERFAKRSFASVEALRA